MVISDIWATLVTFLIDEVKYLMRSTLREEELTWSGEIQIVMVGKSWQWKQEAGGHVASVVKEQREWTESRSGAYNWVQLGMVIHALMPVLWRETQADLYELEASKAYKASSRSAMATYWDPVSNQTQTKPNPKSLKVYHHWPLSLSKVLLKVLQPS